MSGARLTPGFPLSPDSHAVLVEGLIQLLAEPWESARTGLLAPDVLLDFTTQYVANTLREHGQRWTPDQLVIECIQQMRGEEWRTIRGVAQRPLRGSPLSARLFMGLVCQALRRGNRPPLGQLRSVAMVLRSHGASALRLGNALAPPFDQAISHRRLRRVPLAVEDVWVGRVAREMLARHVQRSGLRGEQPMRTRWRLGLVAAVLAHRGAAQMAGARGETEIRRACLEDALARCEHGLLETGRLEEALRSNPLIRDTADRYLVQRSAAASLLSLLGPASL
jgi:hypothetical protein